MTFFRKITLSSLFSTIFFVGIFFGLAVIRFVWFEDLQVLSKENLDTFYLFAIYICILKGIGYCLSFFQLITVLDHLYQNIKFWTWGVGELVDLVLFFILLFFLTIIIPVFFFLDSVGLTMNLLQFHVLEPSGLKGIFDVSQFEPLRINASEIPVDGKGSNAEKTIVPALGDHALVVGKASDGKMYACVNLFKVLKIATTDPEVSYPEMKAQAATVAVKAFFPKGLWCAGDVIPEDFASISTLNKKS